MEERRTNLDFIRGAAALLVTAQHLRSFYFDDYSKIEVPTLFDKGFYFTTGLGHEAVMIFFVLSGFFIGGSVAKDIAKKKWSWIGYASRRLARLWTVLIPALALTFLWDSLGTAGNGHQGYNGIFHHLINSGPSSEIPAQNNALTFTGNLFFLQTIACQSYGTNGPLWSLANEFWYYVLFPVLYFSFTSKKTSNKKITNFFLFILILVLLPWKLSIYGLIWLMGFGSYYCLINPRLSRITSTCPFFLTSGSLFLLSLVWNRHQPILYLDYLTGLAFAGIVPYLTTQNPSTTWYKKISTWLSEISYTLYLVHFPILTFLFFTFFLPERHQPSVTDYSIYGFFLIFVLLYARLVWFFFERQTPKMKEALQKILTRSIGFLK